MRTPIGGLPPRVFVQQGTFSQRGALLVMDVPPAALVRIRSIFTVGRKRCEAHYYVFPRLRLRKDDHVNMTFPEGHPDGARAGVFDVQRRVGIAGGFIQVQLVGLVPELVSETVAKLVNFSRKGPSTTSEDPPQADRRPNSARRLRPGLSPGNTELIPVQATPRASARTTA